MDDDEDDAVTLLLQLLDDLLIYEPGTVLEYAGKKPSRDDLESIQSDTTVRILRILQQYVRPRNEVLRIRRIVTSALQEGNVAEGNVFAEYVQVKEEVERLKEEKKLLTEQLRERSLRKQDDDSHDQAKNMLLGNIFLQKAQKQIQILQIYQRHLNQLIGQKSESQLDNQQTLARVKTLAGLYSPASSSRRDSSIISEEQLEQKRHDLLYSVHTSTKPKQILQSLSFITSLTTQSLQKQIPPSTRFPSQSRGTSPSHFRGSINNSNLTNQSDLEECLFPLKQQLVSNYDKLQKLQSTMAAMPKKEYATTEAKCRALRAARTEALDRLDEMISSSENGSISQEWSHDIKAGEEIIAQRIERIKALIERYHNLRSEIIQLRDLAERNAKKVLEDSVIRNVFEKQLSQSAEWNTPSTIENSPSVSAEKVTLSQLEAALKAKWKIESSQRLHGLLRSEMTTSMNLIKNETLYNISLESPLLRDADLLSQSISDTWRDASMQRRDALKEWVEKKVGEGESYLNSAEEKLEEVVILEREARALEKLGENVL